MKSFIFGVFGFIIAMIIYAILSAEYSDYIAESEMAGWCVDARPIMIKINQSISQKNHTNILISKTIPKSVTLSLTKKVIHTNKVQSNGTIIIQGGHKNQLLVFIPTLTQKSIHWQAHMSPAKLVPSQCQSLPYLNFD